MSRYTSEEILELAVKGNVLIRGWGAAALTCATCHARRLRAYLRAVAERENVLMERVGIRDRAAARREIERNDAAHNGTMQRLFGVDRHDPALYGLVLNTARIPIASCVEHIAATVNSQAFRETAESRQALADQLIRSKVYSALNRRFGS